MKEKTEENEDAVRIAYLKYNVTKVEGLVSATSLVICRVFGPKLFFDYINKTNVKSYSAGIAAYEMLRNLRMHRKSNLYKSKYAKRLIYTLMNTKDLCTYHRGRSVEKEIREFKDWKDDPSEPIEKNNKSTLSKLKFAIGFLLDFMDGEDEYITKICDFKDMENWNVDNLDKLCEMAKSYVEGLIKLETGSPEKKAGVDYVKSLKG